MRITLSTRYKASSHESNFDTRNKKGVEKFGLDWIKTQESVLEAFDVVVDRGESDEEANFVKDLVSLISYTILNSK